MKFSYDWLKEYVLIKKSPEELAELLTLRAFEVEATEKIGNDTVFNIALPPNRVPDAAGHIGMAREIAALCNVKHKTQNTKPKEIRREKTKNFLSVQIQNSNACFRYVGRVMRDVTIADSPEWLQTRLVVCGLRSINNLVDAANYVMLETGQPLHIFDLDKIEGEKIIVRNARQGEKMTTLDQQDVVLTSDDLVIADTKGVLALAGIKGGVKAEVDLKTKHIVLEAATFDGAVIRKTSKRIGIRTDSSYRFEYNLHPDSALFAMQRLTALLADISNGDVAKSMQDVYPKKAKPKKIILNYADVSSYAGIEISPAVCKNILERIGCHVAPKKKFFEVSTPPFRQDLAGSEDLIEEIIRIYGYEIVPERFPSFALPVEKNDSAEWKRLVQHHLVSAGFSEMYQYAFIGEEAISLLDRNTKEYVEIENPTSPDFRYLVREPFESFLSNAKHTLQNADTIKVYNIDKGFSHASSHGGTGEGFEEVSYLTLFFASKQKKSAKEDFYSFKGVITSLLQAVGIADAWFDGAIDRGEKYSTMGLLSLLHPYRRTEIKIGDETLGVLGELHPAYAEKIKSGMEILIAEISWDRLLHYATSEREFCTIPKFPAIVRDIALLVPESTRIEEVQGAIENSGEAILEDVDFFDEYSGEGIQEGMRSLAFTLTFRDEKRTLQDSEVDEAMKKMSVVLRDSGWEVR